MCRMFAYVGSSVEELEMLYDALKKASSHDEMAVRAKMGFSNHADGWGYVILNGDGTVDHYRSGMPIYKDRHVMSRPNGNFYAIFHSREASDKSIINSIFSQPFEESSGKSTIFVVHNGYIDRNKLKVKMDFDGIATDTELAAKLISEMGIEKSMGILEDYTVSALNLIIMEIDKKGDKPEIYYRNYYLPKDKASYYDMYTLKLKKGRAVFSSTLTLFIEGAKKVPNDRLTSL